ALFRRYVARLLADAFGAGDRRGDRQAARRGRPRRNRTERGLAPGAALAQAALRNMRRLLWRKLADIEATLRTAGSSPARRGRWRAERAGGGRNCRATPRR